MEKKIASVEFLVLFSINNDISKASLCANDGIKQRDNKKAIHHVSCRKTYPSNALSFYFIFLIIHRACFTTCCCDYCFAVVFVAFALLKYIMSKQSDTTNQNKHGNDILC